MIACNAAQEQGASLHGIPVCHAEHERLEVHSPPSMLQMAVNCQIFYACMAETRCRNIQQP